jgi:hypothetical protein
MFLGIYRFEGDVTELRQGYERLLGLIPPANLHLHVCVADADGLWVYDTCPSREIFQSFAAGPAFRAALASARLPAPRVIPVGEVHAAFVSAQRIV